MRILSKRQFVSRPFWANPSLRRAQSKNPLVPAEKRPAVQLLLGRLYGNLARADLVKPIVEHSRRGPEIDPGIFSAVGFTPYLLESGLGISLVPHLLRTVEIVGPLRAVPKTIEFRLSKLQTDPRLYGVNFFNVFWAGVTDTDQSSLALAFAETFEQTLKGSLPAAVDGFISEEQIRRERERFTQVSAVVMALYQGRPQIFFESESAGLVIHYY